MAKQPWQESKKKNNGDINREMKRAEIKREQKAKDDALAQKAKKSKQNGFYDLTFGFCVILVFFLGHAGNCRYGAFSSVKHAFNRNQRHFVDHVRQNRRKLAEIMVYCRRRLSRYRLVLCAMVLV